MVPNKGEQNQKWLPHPAFNAPCLTTCTGDLACKKTYFKISLLLHPLERWSPEHIVEAINQV